jgi:hypothetical protein
MGSSILTLVNFQGLQGKDSYGQNQQIFLAPMSYFSSILSLMQSFSTVALFFWQHYELNSGLTRQALYHLSHSTSWTCSFLVVWGCPVHYKCLPASLASTHWMPVGLWHLLGTIKNVPQHHQMLPGGQSHPWLRTTAVMNQRVGNALAVVY